MATIEVPCCFPCGSLPCIELSSFVVSQVVAVDIRPGGCPNSIQPASRGLLPVAILGSADFDVTGIDVATVRLSGVPAVRSGYEDIGFPVEPSGALDGCDGHCPHQRPDGWVDLTLKFAVPDVLEAIEESEGGVCRSLSLTGRLQDASGGTPFIGHDQLRILERGLRKR